MILPTTVRLSPVKRNVYRNFRLSAETRKALRSAMVNRVVEYWQSERLIPEGGIVKELRKAAIQETYQLTGQYAKDSDEVKHLQK